jgi:DNA polymerase-1
VPEIGETAEDDWLMLVADYSQLEMMLAASNCGDTNMLRAIHEGRDLHCNTASLMFRVPYEDVVSAKRKKDAGKPLTPDEKSFHMMRQQAKTIGFGVLYGEGPKKLSVQLDIDFVEARRLQNMFFSAFPTLRRHINNINEACEKSNTAQTLLGRRRRLPNASNPWDKGQRFEALRQAFNFTIQGFAAEIAKQALLDCARDDRLRDLDCHLLMQVHDELLFECPPDAVDEATELIQQHMEGVFPELLKVDLSAEVGQGPNWQEAK